MERNFNGLNKSNYSPFANINNYWLYTTVEGEKKFLQYSDVARPYLLEIKPRGYTPKTGLILAKSIENHVGGKSVLDLCTGETGVIALHAATYGAEKVVGVDIDEETVNWAKHNATINNLPDMQFLVSNLFSNIHSRFNVITVNPPQMPMSNGQLHDSGGESGRDVIERIIRESPNYLLPQGEVYMLLFDFLGVDESYNDNPSIKQMFEKKGFKMRIIDKVKRQVRKGGETEKSLRHIIEKYPLYSFRQEGGDNYHEVLIINAQLV